MIRDHGDLDTERLTAMLKNHGALQRGEVQSVTLEMTASNKGFVCDVAAFAVTYSADVAGPVPGHVFLKVTKPALHQEYRHLGEHEVEFYTTLARSASLPIPQCYAAEWNPAAAHAALVLEDLSHSHTQRPMPIPPLAHHALQIMDSLAQVHAYWWNDVRLGVSIGTTIQHADADAQIERQQRSFTPFVDAFGDALLPAQRAAYERILASEYLQRRTKRLQARHNVTLIHGDAHTNNILLPVTPVEGRVILIDWQRWTIEVPLYDLAFLIALHWTPERRAALERSLLHSYHERLIDYGVTAYTWDACWNDYREAVTLMALIPIGQHRRGMPAGVVWYGMEQSIAAFNDLDCAELL